MISYKLQIDQFNILLNRQLLEGFIVIVAKVYKGSTNLLKKKLLCQISLKE